MLITSGSFDIVQNCWVVPDLELAMKRWTEMGVGPFFWSEASHPEALYRDEPVPLSFRGAIAQAGPIQIELIEQTSEGPSAYTDGVPMGQTGFHHVLRFTDRLEADVSALRAKGICAASTFRSFDDSRIYYMDTREEIGCMLELIPPVPSLVHLFRKVAEASRDWDGRDPVRPMVEAMA